MTAIIILGVDPGLNRCGWGIVLSEGSRLSHIAHGVIKPAHHQQLASRLHDVFEGLSEVIETYQPHEAAVEETFVNSNARAALALGQARGVAMAAAARRGLAVAEYAPTTIKKAVVGSGAADKTQIAFMVQRLLPTAGAVTADAADALGVALCHAAHGGFKRRTSA
ncbi:crossover junction endodeoxyribonuclease RuvC [Candidatus Viadribacter manganicus]|uniref:Crossover junction endodeoxyribonuclease RuvC n=1 Tax=Candidatus Viadribacter manganicus TaxID=1759059 RepID=A0A1B1AK08_9PROT|nr:crossover junction endodeoxyribonuclease RuvC [Candidatus Viadribacter manganicus]ANP46906.1 Holliday junction resolvase [Candidatus Viadribacter manganicus]